MSFLKRLLGMQDHVPMQPDLRNAFVCYSKKGIFIAATCWNKRGFATAGPPRILLPLDATAIDIGEPVLRALESSRAGLSDAEFESLAKMFPFGSIRDWQELETLWEDIHVSSQGSHEEVVIVPMRRYRKGGFGAEESDPVYRCPPVAEEIGKAVRKGIERPTPEPLLTADDRWELGISPAEAKQSERSPLACGTADAVVNVKLRPGDRVVDVFGNQGTVTQIEPSAEHGLGVVRVKFDDGRELGFSLIASGLDRLE